MQLTRRKIVDLLRERGQATVKELADAVGLTQMAVRHHLNVLGGENLVVTSAVRRKNRPGRPQQLYILTEAASELFPESYYRLVGYLLDDIEVTLGKAGLGELFRRIAKRVSTGAIPLHSGQSEEERLGLVVQLLNDKGFSARWETKGNTYVIRLLTCPYRQIVRAHNAVCCLDVQIIKDVLGADPLRVACIVEGDEHCAYRIGRLV